MRAIAAAWLALLGFAAIVTVFRQRDTWRPDGRFWGMVGAGAAPQPVIFSGIFGGSALAFLFLGWSALGWAGGPEFWAYLTGLIWFQIVTATIFIRLLVVWLR